MMSARSERALVLGFRPILPNTLGMDSSRAFTSEEARPRVSCSMTRVSDLAAVRIMASL